MDFNIRAMSVAESVPADARCSIEDLLGAQVTFRGGESLVVTLPAEATEFSKLPEPERILPALDYWTRVFRYPNGDSDSIHVLAVAEDSLTGIVFYRIDLSQSPPPSRRAPRPEAQIAGGAVMNYEECAEWLVNLSSEFSAKSDETQRHKVLQRPRQLKPKLIRIAWVGPEVLDVAMPKRLHAIGRVYGAEIVHVAPHKYAQVAAKLRGILPLDAVILCDHFAPYINIDAVPEAVRRDLVHVCNSQTRPDLEAQIRAWAELSVQEIEKSRHQHAGDEGQTLLKLMLRGMLSHSKIGPFSHCQKTTVLTAVRARRLNVPAAEEILDRNSELHHDTKTSEVLFLWKEHNDGRQYFLNPKKMEEIKTLVG